MSKKTDTCFKQIIAIPLESSCKKVIYNSLQSKKAKSNRGFDGLTM